MNTSEPDFLEHWRQLLTHGGHVPEGALPPLTDHEEARLLSLYVELAQNATWVVAHLGQTLDGRIATEGGVSQFVTGPENLDHAHRMRALADAVVVGHQTVALDDPRLTTRRVPGGHATRVVLDPRLRLRPHHRLFTDAAAPTLVLCREGMLKDATAYGPSVEVVELVGGHDRRSPSALCPRAIVQALHARGLKRIFIEGGGLTVSRFLQAGALDRLQVTVATMILGSGRPSITLPVIEDLDDAIRVPTRTLRMGQDLFFELDLSSHRRPPDALPLTEARP